MDVVALGELLIDFACLSTDSDGYPTMAAHPGGAPANFLAALTKYGAKTALLGKVGADAFGRLLVQTMEKAGIEPRGIVRDESVFTTLAFVTFDNRGEREFSFARKPGADTRLTFRELDLGLIDGAKVFHFGTLSLTDEPVKTATQKAVAYAREKGKMITFDPNLRKPLWKDEQQARDAILWGLHQADFVKISDEEVAFLWSCDEKTAAKKLLTEFGVKLALVTLGSKGAYLANQQAWGFAHCPKVQVVDTTGAGDICGGAALSRILKLGIPLEGLDSAQLEEIASFAVTAASLSTEKSGGIPSIPEEREIEERIIRKSAASYDMS